jgi:hypothetical protein
MPSGHLQSDDILTFDLWREGLRITGRIEVTEEALEIYFDNYAKRLETPGTSPVLYVEPGSDGHPHALIFSNIEEDDCVVASFCKAHQSNREDDDPHSYYASYTTPPAQETNMSSNVMNEKKMQLTRRPVDGEFLDVSVDCHDRAYWLRVNKATIRDGGYTCLLSDLYSKRLEPCVRFKHSRLGQLAAGVPTSQEFKDLAAKFPHLTPDWV